MRFPRRSARGSKRRAQRLLEKAGAGVAKVPPPSNNPATNLLIGDIAMRGVNMIIGRSIEKALLRVRYRGTKASDIVEGRSFVESMAANGAARVATKSVPGFLAVSGALVVKAVFDRAFGGRESARRGEKALERQADKARDS